MSNSGLALILNHCFMYVIEAFVNSWKQHLLLKSNLLIMVLITLELL